MNKTHIHLKLFYFLIYTCIGILGPFLSIYFIKNGFNDIQIGQLLSISTAVAFLSSIVWGYLGDKYQNRNIILFICILGNIISSLILIKHFSFIKTLIIISFFNAFFKPIVPLADSATLDYLNHNNSFSYGTIRVWGTIGFLFATSILSYILNKLEISFIFVFYAFFLVIAMIMPFFLNKFKYPVNTKKISIKKIKQFILDKKIILLLCGGLLVEITNSSIYGYFSYYLKTFNFNNFEIGLVWSTGVIVEIPFIFYSNKIIKKIGLLNCAILAIAVHSIKFLILSFPKIGHFHSIIFLIQICHGIFFGLYYTAMISLFDIYAPSNLKNSSQSIFAAFTYNIGLMVGFWSFGIIKNYFDFFILFKINFFILLFTILLFYYKRKLIKL